MNDVKDSVLKLAQDVKKLAVSSEQCRCRLVQTNRSLRNLVTRGDCECHAKLGDDLTNAAKPPIKNRREATPLKSDV